jgi:hypothetical protein
LRLNAAQGTPGAGDLFSISVLEQDVITDDIVLSETNIDPNAFVPNNGFWEYSSDLVFDPFT